MSHPSFAEEDRISTIVETEPGIPPFALSAGPYARPALTVRSFRGNEAISRPFSFEITIAARAEVDDATIEADLIGKPACLTIQADDTGPRFVRGVLTSLEAQGVVQGGRLLYRACLVPRLWLLGQRKTSRIFQDLSAPAIVQAVLSEAGVPQVWNLMATYRPRTYCVQYQETDLAFLTRLLAEEGIFYFFDHGDGEATSETVTFCDNAHMYPAIEGEPELYFRGSDGSEGLLPAENHVQRFTQRRTLVPSSVLRRGYDFRRPVLDLTRAANLPDPGDAEAAERGLSEIYEHHNEDEQPNIDDAVVRVELEQHRRRATVAEGASACRRLVPGFSFTLVDHPQGRLDQAYVITELTHTGVTPSAATSGERVYENRFECVPADVVARPPRPERGVQQVTETAVVVGPAGQEIHTDEFGRVKVQFPWDREGQRNEHSSCWMRVAQAWAGTGWGAQFIPRIGMEVVVTFLGGDVDRPLITGCVPNAINVPVFPLPGSKTKSGIRTQSSPGGGGYNELSFEDAKGDEQILLRAQRDLRETVLRDHHAHVAGDQSNGVGGGQTNTVTGSQIENVGKNQGISVGGNRAESVGGDRSIAVGGNHGEVVEGHRKVAIRGSDDTKIDGLRHETVVKDYVLQIDGHHSTMVGLGAMSSKADYYVRGDCFMSAARIFKVQADHALVLQCGDSSIELTPDKITIRASALVLAGKDSVSVAAKGPSLELGDTVEISAKKLLLRSEGASLQLDQEASLKGKRVLLNCKDPDPPEQKNDDGTPEEKRAFKLNVKDPDLLPYAKKHYALVVDGTKYEGETGADGLVERSIPKSAESADLTVWVEEYPEGKKLRWHFDVAELLPVATPKGAQMRLKNFGYLTTAPAETMDPAAVLGLKWFQRDHRLEETGELDEATQAALEAAHGH